MILMSRNGELLQLSNHASYKMLEALVNITDQTRRHQETLATILDTSQADSAMLKILSVVATVCLPASLVAVSHPKKLHASHIRR